MRFLSHVTPRAGAGDRFAERMIETAQALDTCARREGCEARLWSRLEDDPFGRKTPFRATLEICGEAVGPDPVQEWLGDFAARLEDVAHPDLSSALLGEDVVFIAPPAGPLVRYQYLMRRNAAYGHSRYLTYYRDSHSQMGLETPAIEGYVQLHVDLAASRSIAAEAGLGIWNVDSVSELHIESLERFFAAVAKSEVPAKAAADEERFVDRPHSMHLCSRVEAITTS